MITLDLTARNAFNKKVHKQFLVVPLIDNLNIRIYSELLKTLESNYLMGQDKYLRDIFTTQKLLVK